MKSDDNMSDIAVMKINMHVIGTIIVTLHEKKNIQAY